jgi:MFS family permease
MPEGVHNVYIFEVFNTASWSVVLAAPMFLFLQHLNATATILGIAACLNPILNILQIPAARFVEQTGYRRFVLMGWTTRSFFIVGMAIVAFLPDTVDRTTRIAVFLLLLFGFNTLRGISACGLLPWFTHIVPVSRRGEFLAKDQLAGALASAGCLFVSGSLLNLHLIGYSFSIVFAIAAVAAFISLYFLRRIPDVPVEKIVRNENPVPWKDMFLYPPFLKYLRYNCIVNTALGASGVFWVRYFRDFLHISNANVLYIGSLTTIALAICLFMAGRLIDRSGNKPALTVSGIFLTLHFTGWGLVAAGILPCDRLVILVQTITSAIGGSLWNLANMRTVMGIVPEMGRAHFLALYSVVANVTVGVVPLLWGPVMDCLSHWHTSWGYWQWNCYSLLYMTMAVTIAIGLVALRSVEEPKTMTWNVFMHELLVQTPSRAVSRVIGRLRGPGI